jgi:hypothetical protein
MNLKFLSLSAAVVVTSVLSSFANPAQAFQFTTNYTASGAVNAAEGDIHLDSVKLQSGEIRTQFSLVTAATIKYNDQYIDGNTGAASADRTIKATTGLIEEALTNNGLIQTLNNRFLSNIIDTEKSGSFTFDLSFDKAVDNIFFWERGGKGATDFGNSRMDIQALDDQGNLIGNVFTAGQVATSGQAGGIYSNAGYKLLTTEMFNSGDETPQNVGSLGISLADLGVKKSISKIRVVSKSDYNGADWKLVGSTAPNLVKATPEPSIALGIGAAALASVMRKRNKRNI